MKPEKQSRILVVDDEASVTGALNMIFNDSGYEVETAHTVALATRLLSERHFDVVLTDFRLADATGIDLIRYIKKEMPETEVILMSGFGSLDITIEAIKRGAYYYIEKPCAADRILALIERALEFAALKHENQVLKRTLAGDSEVFGMIGRDPKMRQIIETIRTAAPSDASVLIEGESGTGKELIATALHTQGHRAAAPFIRINCAAIPHELIESELFGYKRGAFTGADRDKRGLIEAANGGTLLLDEIGEMPVHLQTKLLRVLQERKLRRVGDEREIDVDFRLVSATNRDTGSLVQQEALRRDLYFRISTIKIKVPPLRERIDDVLPLAQRFLERYNRQYAKTIQRISQPALVMLARYDWPGNIRELESVIERAVLFCPGEEIMPGCLPEDLQVSQNANFKFIIPPFLGMEEIEREAILQTLVRTSGNVKKSAQILHCPRPTFYRKLKKFGIKVER